MADMGPALDLQQTVDRYAAPDYSQGHSVPDTLQGQDLPVLDTAASTVSSVDAGHNSSTYATRGDTRRAQRGAPNNFGWREQARMEISGFRETVVPIASNTVNVDPNQATIWEISPPGNLTITISGSEGYDPPDPTAPVPYVATSVVLWIMRQAGATISWPAGLKWSSTITATTFAAPTAQRLDCYVLVYTPLAGGWLGHVISQGYA